MIRIKIDKQSLTLFSVFFFSIFLKCLLFHYSCFNYIAVRSLLRNPFEFFTFYSCKILPAIFISSFVFLFSKQKWTITISFLIDIWLIVNSIYYRINGVFLDFDTILVVENLNGFCDSIKPFLSIIDLIYVGITLVYIILCHKLFYLKSIKISLINYFKCVLICVLLIVLDVVYGSTCHQPSESAFQTAVRMASGNTTRTLTGATTIERGSIFHYFPCYIIYKICVSQNDKVSLSLEDRRQISKIISYSSNSIKIKPNSNLIIVLIESFESWSIDSYVGNKLVAPNLNRIKQGSCLYCSKIKSQVKAGMSGDGQMIVNTGLLPISSGAACILYGSNTYPNIAHFYDYSVVIDACAGKVWNQVRMSKNYGYKCTIPYKGIAKNDAYLIDLSKLVLDTLHQPFVCQLITVSTHSPFTSVEKHSLNFNKNMPITLQNYLNSIHYTDSCIGVLVDFIKNKNLLNNTTLVITGDHTIFKKGSLQNFKDFAKKYQYPIPDTESYCPLIIYSPTIPKHMEISDVHYQMDIFPTIINCIGVDGYYWKGFGHNLLDSLQSPQVSFDETDSYLLSDKIIRSNYLQSYK